jgi:two-component system, OmpR family, copper resistance phosphate regulon response regulator CusR
MRILVVEDEPKLAEFIKKGLEENSWKVDTAYDGQIGMLMAISNVYDILIIDVNLPKINGYDLTTQLRNEGNKVPVLMLTAMGSLDDKLTGFNAGADDYLIKPFEFKELLARLRSLHRRVNENFVVNTILQISDLELDLNEKIARREGKRIELTAREFGLLEYFIRNKGKVVSRVDIAENVWDIHFDTGTNTIDVYVNFLRKKIDRGFSPKLLHTVIGMGYIMKEE